ncbi:MAG: hypothetical protein Q4B60_05035, partial [Erysipelotrichaceae bacterium]|nr:hypothetical protein [Erysipelotrichaceae bacterium]
MKKILMCLLILMCLCACGKESKIRNNTSGLYKLISKEKEIKEVLNKNVFEIEGPSSLKGYIFKEDGTFIEDYYGAYPGEYFRVGALNDIEKVGEWKIEEETTVLISCDGVNLHYKLYEFEKEYTLIPADWDPDYEGKYASLYEDDKEYFYDNTP